MNCKGLLAHSGDSLWYSNPTTVTATLRSKSFMEEKTEHKRDKARPGLESKLQSTDAFPLGLESRILSSVWLYSKGYIILGKSLNFSGSPYL